MKLIRRFVGALALDAAAFEEVEADRFAGIQSGLVVAAACASTGFAMINIAALSPNPEFAIGEFAIGMWAAIVGWIIWVMLIRLIGTRLMPESQTRSSTGELLRTMGFAAAPGVFYGLAAMPAIAPVVALAVSAWMIAAMVVAVRQALDYRHTGRAIAVCVTAWGIAVGLVVVVAVLFTTPVS